MHGSGDEAGGRDPFEGMERAEGAEAEAEASRAARAARAGGVDPLEGLVGRVRAGGLGVAFDARALDAAAAQRERDPAAHVDLRHALKGVKGFPVREWDRQLDARARERPTGARRRQAEAPPAAAPEAAPPEAPAGEPPALAAHRVEVVDDGGVTYRMTPGRTVVVTAGRRGPEATTLAHVSARIVLDVEELAAPEAPPRRVRTLSLVCDGDGFERRADVAAGAWSRGDWLDTLIPARGRVPADRRLRARLLDAIAACSAPAEVRRYGFIGWQPVGAGLAYLHAGGAIGEGGPVPGVDVRPPSPADRLRLPDPPEGEALARALRAAVAFLDVEPADVAVPLFGMVFRAAMGVLPITVHITGRKGTGKSLVAGLAQKFFGADACNAECTGEFPGSWADGSTAKGVSGTLAVVGDAVAVVDDLKVSGARDEGVFKLFEDVTRAHFNRTSRRARSREGLPVSYPPTRAAILSTGEVLPQGHSTRDRVVSLFLPARPAPDLEAFARAEGLRAAGRDDEAKRASSLDALRAAANAGDLAACTAAFLRWHAPRAGAWGPSLAARAQEAAARWGLGASDRAAVLLGPLALGLEAAFAFLAEHGALAGDALTARKRRALDAMRRVAAAHLDTVEAEDPARRFCELVAEALAAGAAYVEGLRPPPRGGTCEPPSPELFGWRSEARGDGREWVHRGAHVGYLARNRVEVDLVPGPAFTVARERAQREGHPLAIDKDGLGDALRAAGLLARLPAPGRRGDAVKLRVGGAELRVWALRLDALGIALPPEDAGEDHPAAGDAEGGGDEG